MEEHIGATEQVIKLGVLVAKKAFHSSFIKSARIFVIFLEKPYVKQTDFCLTESLILPIHRYLFISSQVILHITRPIILKH